jgi:pimeloyl-ACP methyl ester carboxylesterase
MVSLWSKETACPSFCVVHPPPFRTFLLTRRELQANDHHQECDDGGHFAALEKPDIFLADCRKFFGTWYKA